MPNSWRCLAIILLLAAERAQGAQMLAAADLSRLSIEDLANLQITAVAREPQPLNKAPAAVFVITAEDIRRSGATSVPEALRLAPNLQVAQIDAGGYAITARGFNHNTGTANKLQVMIDGRVVYTPLFSGVFWDERELPLDDIERIEVISGPGGALWGSNAVNGIISIVTKNAHDTQGALVNVSGGSRDQTATFRYGGKINENTALRIYGMAVQRGALVTATGADAHDSIGKLRAGFRGDWARGMDAVSLQGDVYKGVAENQLGELQNTANSGSNILGRWTRNFAGGQVLQTQAYFNRAVRDSTSGITATFNAYDIDTQYSFALGSRQSIVVGGGYRVTTDVFQKGPATSFLVPDSRTLQLANGFVHDQIQLTDSLTLTLGLKVENYSYAGTYFMPDARVAWTVFGTDLIWSSVSRAVRAPARFDRDLVNTGLLIGGPDFRSENVVAYELGYRGQLGPSLSFSASAFYNTYDDLRSVEATTALVFPLVVKNSMKGETYGVELWGNYAVTPWWRLSAGANTLRKDLRFDPGARDVFGVQFAGNDPAYQFQLRSDMTLGNFALTLGLRAVDDLPSPRVPGYAELDVRMGWSISSSLELWLAGYNLLRDRHTEFINPSLPVREVPRTVTAGARWRF